MRRTIAVMGVLLCSWTSPQARPMSAREMGQAIAVNRVMEVRIKEKMVGLIAQNMRRQSVQAATRRPVPEPFLTPLEIASIDYMIPSVDIPEKYSFFRVVCTNGQVLVVENIPPTRENKRMFYRTIWKAGEDLRILSTNPGYKIPVGVVGGTVKPSYVIRLDSAARASLQPGAGSASRITRPTPDVLRGINIYLDPGGAS